MEAAYAPKFTNPRTESPFASSIENDSKFTFYHIFHPMANPPSVKKWEISQKSGDSQETGPQVSTRGHFEPLRALRFGCYGIHQRAL